MVLLRPRIPLLTSVASVSHVDWCSMAARSSYYLGSGIVLLLEILTSFVYGPGLWRAGLVLSVLRPVESTPAADLVTLENTVHCEDLHYHEPSELLFTACKDDETVRHAWFPPLAILDDPVAASKARGSIKVIGPRVRWFLFPVDLDVSLGSCSSSRHSRRGRCDSKTSKPPSSRTASTSSTTQTDKGEKPSTFSPSTTSPTRSASARATRARPRVIRWSRSFTMCSDPTRSDMCGPSGIRS